MKIFSNFDTEIKKKEKQKFVNEFGSDKVLVITRSRVFLFMKIIIPICIYCLVSMGATYIAYKYAGVDWLWFIGGIALLLGLLAIGTKVKEYIDYKMDFAIVTPEEIIMYNQRGLLNRSVVGLEGLDLKAIVMKKSGLLYSMFDIGDLMFLTEGDQSQADFTLYYISKPDMIKNKIYDIIKRV